MYEEECRSLLYESRKKIILNWIPRIHLQLNLCLCTHAHTYFNPRMKSLRYFISGMSFSGNHYIFYELKGLRPGILAFYALIESSKCEPFLFPLLFIIVRILIPNPKSILRLLPRTPVRTRTHTYTHQHKYILLYM